MVEKVEKKVESQGDNSNKLTQTEEEVLILLADEHLTVIQTAVRRQTTKQATYKIRKNLIKKGFLNNANMRVEKKGGCSQPQRLKIRLHNEQYHINILWADERYRKKIAKGTKRIHQDGNTIMLYRNCIDVYSNTSFYGDTPTESDSKALRYWKVFFNKLEYDLKIIIVKERSENITRSRCEYAEVGNELAKQLIKEHDKIKIVGDDGKIWLLVDNSHNFKELETVNPKTSKQDMENTVQPFFNDLRENEQVTMSDLKKIIGEIANGVQANTLTLKAILQINKTSEIEKPNDDNYKMYYIG